jgi:hypothetical protein
VTPAAGYALGPEPLVRAVDVIKGQTTQVTFVLRRGTSPVQRRPAATLQPPNVTLQLL